MKTEIPFLEELRSDLLEHAPIDVRASRTAARRSRGPLVAVAAFALVIVVGGMAWILRGDRVVDDGDVGSPDLIAWDLQVTVPPAADLDAPTAEFEAMPGVAEVQYLADLSVLYPVDPDVSSPGPGRITGVAVMLIRLDDDADPAAVAARIGAREDVYGVTYSPEIGAARADDFFTAAVEGGTVMADDPYIVRPSPGPEPQFDPSTMGREVRLEEPGSVQELAGRIEELETRPPSVTFFPSTRDEDRPALFIGRVADIESELLIYPTEGDGFCDMVMSDDGSQGSGCGDFTYARFGLASAGSGGLIGHVTVVVPSDTSIVTLTATGSETMWQRPRAGWGFFPARVHDGVTFEVRAYDVLGNEMGRWETTS